MFKSIMELILRKDFKLKIIVLVMIGKYSEEDGRKLLQLARESIWEKFSGKKPEIPTGKQFNQARGVFVTIFKKGKLRGCVGFPYPEFSVADAIYRAAKEAAFSDFRFSSLEEKEISEIKIEISILTMPEDCEPKEVKVGEDGIMVNYLGYSGLLLPQVAVEYKMDRIKFLEALCSKASLPKDKWQDKNFKLKKFSCQIFKENDK